MSDRFFAKKSKKARKLAANAADKDVNHSTNGASKTRDKSAKRLRSEEEMSGRDRRSKRVEDEELEQSSDDMDMMVDTDLEDEASDHHLNSDEELEQRETEAEKRLRLAKQYIERLKIDATTGEGEYDAAEIDRDIIADRLREDALESIGKLYRKLADQFVMPVDEENAYFLRGHQLAVTCAVMTPNGRILYSGSKDGSIIKWDLEQRKKIKVIPGGRKGTADYPGHTDHVLALAVSTDGQFLASGGRDKVIHIWSVADDKLLTSFRQHKDAITGLAFRKGHNQLYSASMDRSVKVWNVDQLSYVETLFGHQDVIGNIDALAKERCITSGTRDRTIRLWKIVDETQLVFRGGGTGLKKSTLPEEAVKDIPLEGSVDCVAMINEDYFITGGDSGVIALWHIGRKRPIYSIPCAHGVDEETGSGQPRWITAVATLRYSDLFATGSWDGVVRLWKISEELDTFSSLGTIAMTGFVNHLQFIEPQSNALLNAAQVYLVAGLGQEHRFGRWLRLSKAKNGTRVVQLSWREDATPPKMAALRLGGKRRRQTTHDEEDGVDIADL